MSLLPNTSVSSAITCVVGNFLLPSGSSGKSSPGREAIAGQYGYVLLATFMVWLPIYCSFSRSCIPAVASRPSLPSLQSLSGSVSRLPLIAGYATHRFSFQSIVYSLTVVFPLSISLSPLTGMVGYGVRTFIAHLPLPNQLYDTFLISFSRIRLLCSRQHSSCSACECARRVVTVRV